MLHHRDNHIGRSLLQQNWWPTSLLTLSSQFPQLTSSCRRPYSVVFFFPRSHYLPISEQKPVATGSFLISLQTGCRADFRKRGVGDMTSVSSKRKACAGAQLPYLQVVQRWRVFNRLLQQWETAGLCGGVKVSGLSQGGRRSCRERLVVRNF